MHYTAHDNACPQVVSEYKKPLADLQGRASNVVKQITGNIPELYCHAALANRPFGKLMISVESVLGPGKGELTHSTTQLKATKRILEKSFLSRKDPGNAERVCDIVLCMVVVKLMAEFVELLEELVLRAARGEIVIVRIKDRIQHPSAGWRDVMVHFYLMGDNNKHICEVGLLPSIAEHCLVYRKLAHQLI